ELFEPETPFEQCGAYTIREAEFRLVWRFRIHLLHDFVSRSVRFDLDAVDSLEDIVTRPCPSRAQVERAIHGRVRVTAAGIKLVAVLTDFPPHTQAVGNTRLIMRAGHGPEEPAFSLEDSRGAGEARAREVGRKNPVHRGFPRVQVLAHRA